jgi:hypothetical protein
LSGVSSYKRLRSSERLKSDKSERLRTGERPKSGERKGGGFMSYLGTCEPLATMRIACLMVKVFMLVSEWK